MSASPKPALTSTSSSSYEVLQNRGRTIARLVHLVVLDLSSAEIRMAELLRPHRVAELTAAEREGLLRLGITVRGARRFMEEVERRWKARLESFPKS